MRPLSWAGARRGSDNDSDRKQRAGTGSGLIKLALLLFTASLILFWRSLAQALLRPPQVLVEGTREWSIVLITPARLRGSPASIYLRCAAPRRLDHRVTHYDSR